MLLFSVGSGKHQEDWLHAEESLKEGIHFYVKVSICSTDGERKRHHCVVVKTDQA